VSEFKELANLRFSKAFPLL